MSSKSLFATAIATATVAATVVSIAMPAQAGGQSNDKTLNGVFANGSRINDGSPTGFGVRLEAIELPPAAK